MHEKPLICTFPELVNALEALHQRDKAKIASLHDIWKLGAPTPQSGIFDPKHFDERVINPLNYVSRIVLPTPLAQWIRETSAARGFPYSIRQSLNLVFGVADYEI